MQKKLLRHELLNKLFLNPSCSKKKEFTRLRPLIFPNEDTFLAFIESTNTHEQQKLARELIERLLHDLKFFIPPSYVENVFSYEENIKPRIKTAHITRDHYVHLVYSYMQAIYTFFYIDTFRKRITEEISSIKSAYNRSNNYQIPITPYEDSIFCIKLFTICHDVGYPWEQYSFNKNHSDYDGFNWNDYLSPFLIGNNLIVDELTSRFISRMIATCHITIRKGRQTGEDIIKFLVSNSNEYNIEDASTKGNTTLGNF